MPLTIENQELPETGFILRSKRRSKEINTETKSGGTELYTVVFESAEQANQSDPTRNVEAISIRDYMASLLDEKYTAYGLRKYGIVFVSEDSQKTYILKECWNR